MALYLLLLEIFLFSARRAQWCNEVIQSQLCETRVLCLLFISRFKKKIYNRLNDKLVEFVMRRMCLLPLKSEASDVQLGPLWRHHQTQGRRMAVNVYKVTKQVFKNRNRNTFLNYLQYIHRSAIIL